MTGTTAKSAAPGNRVLATSTRQVVVAGQQRIVTARSAAAAGDDAERRSRRGQPILHRCDRSRSCVAALPSSRPNQRWRPNTSAIRAARLGGPSMTIRRMRDRSIVGGAGQIAANDQVAQAVADQRQFADSLQAPDDPSELLGMLVDRAAGGGIGDVEHVVVAVWSRR